MTDNRSSFKGVLRAFQHRNYRLFFVGQSVSLIGTWMQQVAMGWLVYRLTDSAFLLGVVAFSGQVPTFLLAAVAGVYADRWNRARLFLITQALSMIQAFVLAYLTMTGQITVWHIIAMSVLLGLILAFDIPVRQSFVVALVDRKEDLGNAIALNSLMMNGARLIGPSIAGVLIGLVGEGICFLINGLSFLGILVALMSIKVREPDKKSSPSHLWRELREGFYYAWGFIPIRYILLLIALVSFIGVPYSTLLPVFARDILQGGPHTLGFLMASSGVGALTGSLFLASRVSVRGLGRWIAAASMTFGAGIIAFSQSGIFYFSGLMMLFIGFGLIVQIAGGNTIVQTIVDEEKRGRVMSFFTMAFMGMPPFGSLFLGFLASRMGAPLTLMVGGVVCILGGLLFAMKLSRIREEVRPIYRRMGIISSSDTQ
jgi:MFS family permease